MFKYCPYCGTEVKEQNKDGFQCPNCKNWVHYASNPAVSVAVKVGDEGLVAIRGREPGIGKMDLVGGFLENGEDPIDCAIREFKEEAGVNINKEDLKFLGIWIDIYLYQGQNQFVLNIVYLIELPEKMEVKPADDVADLIWVPLSEKPNFAFPYLYKVWEKIRD